MSQRSFICCQPLSSLSLRLAASWCWRCWASLRQLSRATGNTLQLVKHHKRGRVREEACQLARRGSFGRDAAEGRRRHVPRALRDARAAERRAASGQRSNCGATGPCGDERRQCGHRSGGRQSMRCHGPASGCPRNSLSNGRLPGYPPGCEHRRGGGHRCCARRGRRHFGHLQRRGGAVAGGAEGGQQPADPCRQGGKHTHLRCASPRAVCYTTAALR